MIVIQLLPPARVLHICTLLMQELASPTGFFMGEQACRCSWVRTGHTDLFPHEAAIFNYLIYLQNNFIMSFWISSYMVELANSSPGPCIKQRSYKHSESTVLITYSATASTFKMNENQRNNVWFQDYKNKRWERLVRACAPAPVWPWTMASCVIGLGYFGSNHILNISDDRLHLWSWKTNLENNKFSLLSISLCSTFTFAFLHWFP